jgi:hypothetical protein
MILVIATVGTATMTNPPPRAGRGGGRAIGGALHLVFMSVFIGGFSRPCRVRLFTIMVAAKGENRGVCIFRVALIK